MLFILSVVQFLVEMFSHLNLTLITLEPTEVSDGLSEKSLENYSSGKSAVWIIYQEDDRFYFDGKRLYSQRSCGLKHKIRVFIDVKKYKLFLFVLIRDSEPELLLINTDSS